MKCVAFGVLLLLAFVACFTNVIAADCEVGDKKVNTGETFHMPGECSIYTCTGKGSFTAKTCAESLAPPKCKLIPQDNAKPWPDCCKRYEC